MGQTVGVEQVEIGADRVPWPAIWGPCILQAAFPDPECGCPVEEWVVAGMNLTLHFEPDGTMEAHADNGDWDGDVPLKARTMEAARWEAFEWAASLPSEDEVAGSPTQPRPEIEVPGLQKDSSNDSTL